MPHPVTSRPRLLLAAGIALALGLPALPVTSHAAGASEARAAARHALRMENRRQRNAGIAIAATQRAGGTRATLPVTSCADDGGAGTLRSVLYAANEGDTVDLSALTCGTITLTQGEIDISVLGDDQVNDITIVGPGRDLLTIDANNDRFIYHGDFQTGLAQLRIRDLTIANGLYTHGLASCIDTSGDAELTRVTITGCRASGGSPLTFGGAVSVSGDLTMVDSTITGSSSTAAGNAVAIGGGAYVSGDLSLVDSTISGNSVTAVTAGDGEYYLTAGGGAYVRGALTARNSTVSGNTINATGTSQDGIGAGIYVRAETDIEGTTFDNNTADGAGGGLYKDVYSVFGDPGTLLEVRNSTFSGNTALRGAGLVAKRPTTLANSTIAFNTGAEGAGGALFTGDMATTLDLQSVIIASNSAGSGATLPTDLSATGPLAVTGANNLVMNAGTLALPAGTLTADPQLAPLADNGGRTRTHAIEEDSVAFDAGNNAAALATDQRGSTRVVGAAADIGAFEWVSDVIFADGFDPAAATVTYQYDDGDGDTNQGPPSSFSPDMLWGNYYTTQPGGTVITRIEVAFGPTFPSLANGPVTFWLLDDPDADGDPRNAILLTSVQGTPDVFNDTFFSVTIPPTAVSGAFFVGASAKLAGGVDRPARVDRDAPGTNSWFFYAPEIADVIDDLNSAPFGSQNTSPTVPLPGAFMVRAIGTVP